MLDCAGMSQISRFSLTDGSIRLYHKLMAIPKSVWLVSAIPSLLPLIVIIYGTLLSQRHGLVFVGLQEDEWESIMPFIQGILAGHIFPFRNPLTGNSDIVSMSPLNFWIVAGLSFLSGVNPWAVSQILCIIFNFLLCLVFYHFSCRILKDGEKGFYALLLFVFASSLTWLRFLPLALQNPQVVWESIINILQGRPPDLTLPTQLKESIRLIVWSSLDLRLRTPRFAYFQLALILAFISTLIFIKALETGKTSYLILSGFLLGLVHLAHVTVALTWDLLLLVIWLNNVIKTKKLNFFHLSIIILATFIISGFYVIPAYRAALPSLRGAFVPELTPFETPKYPYPWELPEAYGLAFFLGLGGLYLSLRKKNDNQYRLIPTFLLLFGAITSNLWFVGSLGLFMPHFIATILARPEFFRLGLSLLGAYSLAYIMRLIRKKSLFLTLLVILLWASTIVGFCVFTLTIAVKPYPYMCVPQQDYATIIWLKNNVPESSIIYGPWNASYALNALTKNMAPLGIFVTPSHIDGLLPVSEINKRLAECKVVYETGNYDQTVKVLKDYNVDYLWAFKDTAQSKLEYFQSTFRVVYENEAVIIFAVKLK